MSSKKRLNLKLPRKILVILAIFLFGAAAIYIYYLNSPRQHSVNQAEKNTPRAFISEIYDKVKENYWNNVSETELLEMFRLSIDRSGEQQISVAKFEGKDKLLNYISDMTVSLDEERKVRFLTSVVSSVLINLKPAGRSSLYTEKLEAQLKNTVENINPDKDLYKDLGLAKGASEAAVTKAYIEQAKELEEKSTPESQEKLKQISYAKEVLTEKDKKEKYDQKGIEPTIFSKVYKSSILYIQFKKFSPTALEEFQKAFEAYKDDNELVSLMLDLRGNIGGAIDSTAYFLGFFLGKNQYAFDFYHKGEYQPFKTSTDKLPSLEKYKQVVVLVDQNTQSSAEMMAASIKKYHLGVVLGVPTKGWGTVERVFPLDNQITSKEKYSIFLVHSITLRDDNQPIEGRGVEPDININSSDWEKQLFNYFRNAALTSAVKQVL